MQATNGDADDDAQEKAATNGGGAAQEPAPPGFTIGLGVALQVPVPGGNLCCRARNDPSAEFAPNCSGGTYEEFEVWIALDVNVVPHSAGSVKGHPLHKGVTRYIEYEIFESYRTTEAAQNILQLDMGNQRHEAKACVGRHAGATHECVRVRN